MAKLRAGAAAGAMEEYDLYITVKKPGIGLYVCSAASLPDLVDKSDRVFDGGTGWDDEQRMSKRFKVGDHVTWNSEAGRVWGTIIAGCKECPPAGTWSFHLRHCAEWGHIGSQV